MERDLSLTVEMTDMARRCVISRPGAELILSHGKPIAWLFPDLARGGHFDKGEISRNFNRVSSRKKEAEG